MSPNKTTLCGWWQVFLTTDLILKTPDGGLHVLSTYCHQNKDNKLALTWNPITFLVKPRVEDLLSFLKCLCIALGVVHLHEETSEF